MFLDNSLKRQLSILKLYFLRNFYCIVHFIAQRQKRLKMGGFDFQTIQITSIKQHTLFWSFGPFSKTTYQKKSQ